ncbi:hypothetical protein BDD43_5016 [Mucilaginibacter gracilis]|uniref:Uncharacterized protein n=1 Tax=Mucilaginibacter gracilis TaxID=423350 RepID=A0A495J8N8_9SPHI|nr:hypothetical protein [Mucilaginibacter gracilis]RKR84764.1 hypothetical protein BDD43_5016 [Mucilaginibacter gracilis]
MIDTLSWNISTNAIQNYTKGDWDDDCFFETIDAKYGIYIYAISEWRMGAYAAQIAIYSNKVNVIPAVNSSTVWVYFSMATTFSYLPLSDCLIFKMLAFKDNPTQKTIPYLLIKPLENSFAFIPYDFNSIYHGFNEVKKDTISLNKSNTSQSDGIPNLHVNEVFDIAGIEWFNLENFDNALSIYHRLIGR